MKYRNVIMLIDISQIMNVKTLTQTKLIKSTFGLIIYIFIWIRHCPLQ